MIKDEIVWTDKLGGKDVRLARRDNKLVPQINLSSGDWFDIIDPNNDLYKSIIREAVSEKFEPAPRPITFTLNMTCNGKTIATGQGSLSYQKSA